MDTFNIKIMDSITTIVDSFTEIIKKRLITFSKMIELPRLTLEKKTKNTQFNLIIIISLNMY